MENLQLSIINSANFPGGFYVLHILEITNDCLLVEFTPSFITETIIFVVHFNEDLGCCSVCVSFKPVMGHCIVSSSLVVNL